MNTDTPKSRIGFAYVLLAVIAASPLVYALDPTIHYSDLDSGPPQSYVTVWGKAFSTSDAVTVAGTTAEVLSRTPSRIEFRVPAAGCDSSGIRVGASNILPFSIRPGRIFSISQSGSNASAGTLASPWRDFANAKAQARPGDIVYVRSGTYTGVLKPTYGASIFLDYSGSPGLPIALVGYPGETPVIGTSTASRAIMFFGGAHDWTIAKLRLVAGSAATHMAKGNFARIRLIGLEASGIPSAYGTIGMKGCTDCKILGNHVFNSGRAGNKLAHLIYYGGYGVGANLEIAWNLLHDEKGGRGIQIYGHTDSDRLSGLSIHDNTVYNIPYDGILVGGSDAAFKPWITDAAVYNNTVYNTAGGIRVDNTGVAARVTHNTLYNNSVSIKLEDAKSAEVRDNISSVPIRSHVTVAHTRALILDHNGYHGPRPVPAQDKSPVTGDPLFVDVFAGDFSLKPDSPMAGMGARP